MTVTPDAVQPSGQLAEKLAVKGWTPERRAAQAARILARKPWLKSTGPRSPAGKKRCRMNGLKHGARSADWRELSRLLRAQQLFVKRWREGRYHPPKSRFPFARSRGMSTSLRQIPPSAARQTLLCLDHRTAQSLRGPPCRKS